ncbi:hypothetical protein KKB80_05970, partial [bacterium]|nr:hypothetical protein [bacterium]
FLCTFFSAKKYAKSSCNGFEPNFVRFPRKSKSIPKNAKLTTFRQLHFFHVITLLFLGSAGVATDGDIWSAFSLCHFGF